jgi:hypothetical protein
MKADRLKRMGSSRQRGWPVAEWLSQAGTGPIPRTRGDELFGLPPPNNACRGQGGGTKHLTASS